MKYTMHRITVQGGRFVLYNIRPQYPDTVSCRPSSIERIHTGLDLAPHITQSVLLLQDVATKRLLEVWSPWPLHWKLRRGDPEGVVVKGACKEPQNLKNK